MYQNDHLGYNRVITNASGTVTQKNHYYPFGTTFAESTSSDNQPKELDKMHGLNLYDYSARYYESEIGRFTTVDPMAEKYYSINPYAYVANNPMKFIDPDREFPWVAAIVGGGLGYPSQVVVNRIEGKSWSKSLTDVDVVSIGVSATASATGVGLVGIVSKL